MRLWLFLVVGAVVLGQLIIRLWPVDTARQAGKLEAMAQITDAGERKVLGGYVTKLDAKVAPAFSRLLEETAKLPRTSQTTSQPNSASFVSRSAIWGFPDAIRIWTDSSGSLWIGGHLVFGQSDLGVNERRIKTLLKAANS